LPMLFVLVVDVLQRMLNKSNQLLHQAISPLFPQATLTLQYTDDMTLISTTDINSLVMVNLVLRVFARVFGLTINYEKSSFKPFNVPPQQER
jgi:Reverse transcriptase (RNA-dependent DNA polymerase)